MIEKMWPAGALHGGAHLGFFSGVGMLLPIMSQAWELHIRPWLHSPMGFFIGIGLVVLSIAVIAYMAGSIHKVFRSVGWLLLIPGVIAILFTTFGEIQVWSWAQNSITGFSVAEPAIRWLVYHSVPSAAIIGGVYILLGIMFIWAGRKLYNLTDYI